MRLRQNSAADDTGTNTYGEARVSVRPTFAAGTITFDPGPSAAALPETPVVANNVTEALVLDLPLRFEDGHNYLNAALTEFPFEKRIVPITLVSDGDMIKSTVSSADWTAGGSATLAKTAGSFYVPRYLSIAGAATSQYGETVPITVEQGESYYLEVMASKFIAGASAAADGSLTFHDVTNATTFTLDNSAIDERWPTILANNVSMAATTEQVKIRINKTDVAGTQIVLCYYIILRKNSQRIFTIQDRPAKLLWLGELRAASGGKYEDRSWTNMAPIPAKTIQRDAGIWEYHTQQSTSGLSLWYEEFVQPVVMTADSDTSAIEVEDLAAVVAEMWLHPLKGLPQWREKYERALRKSVEVRQRRMAALQTARQAEQYVISPLGV